VWLPPWLRRTTGKTHLWNCIARLPSRDPARRLSACSGVDGSARQGREDIPDRQSREDMPQRPQGFTLAWPEGCGTLRRKAAETKTRAAAPGAAGSGPFPEAIDEKDPSVGPLFLYHAICIS